MFDYYLQKHMYAQTLSCLKGRDIALAERLNSVNRFLMVFNWFQHNWPYAFLL